MWFLTDITQHLAQMDAILFFFIILGQNMQFTQFVLYSVCDGSTENRKAQKLRVKNKHCLSNKMHRYVVTEVHFVNEVHKMTNSRHIKWDTWGKHSQHCYHSGFTELTIFPELGFQEGVIRAWLFLRTLWLLKCSCCQCQNQVLPSWYMSVVILVKKDNKSTRMEFELALQLGYWYALDVRSCKAQWLTCQEALHRNSKQ